jgi:hypothetical protein
VRWAAEHPGGISDGPAPELPEEAS